MAPVAPRDSARCQVGGQEWPPGWDPALPGAVHRDVIAKSSDGSQVHLGSGTAVAVATGLRGTTPIPDISALLEDSELTATRPTCMRNVGCITSPTSNMWGFAIYCASHDGYEDSYLPTGTPSRTAEDVFDTACGLYINDPKPGSARTRRPPTVQALRPRPASAPSGA